MPGTTATRGLLREPLVHFLVAGAALFILAAALGGPGESRPARIVIGQEDIARLAAGFAATWRRPPTELELRGLVENAIKEEVYYREAVVMGLDRDDVIVRRRMQQKL